MSDFNIIIGKPLMIKLMRSFLSGCCSCAFHVCVFSLMKEFFLLQLQLANALGFCMGVLMNYLIHKFWVFPNSDVKGRLNFILFLGLNTVGLCLHSIFFWIGTEINLNIFVALALSSLLVFLFTFTLSSNFIFKR